jgi:hypothetical protein
MQEFRGDTSFRCSRQTHISFFNCAKDFFLPCEKEKEASSPLPLILHKFMEERE